MKIVVVGGSGLIGSTLVTMLTRGGHWSGAVLRDPAKQPLKTYSVTPAGDVGRIDVPLAQAVQGEVTS